MNFTFFLTLFYSFSQIIPFIQASPQNEYSKIFEILQKYSESGIIYDKVESPLCISHVNQWLSELSEWKRNEGAPSTWALQMMDAWGKFPDGLLSGHIRSLGDFSECVQIHVDSSGPAGNSSGFSGRYCTTYISPQIPESIRLIQAMHSLTQPKGHHLQGSVSLTELLTLMADPTGLPMIPVMGQCFPSSCSQADIQNIINNTVSLIMGEGVINPTVVYCTTDEKPPFKLPAIIMMVIISAFGFLCILGTGIDVLFRSNPTSTTDLIGRCLQVILAFSVVTNTQKWLDTSTPTSAKRDLSCLHGIRFLTCAWIILCHSFFMVLFQSTWNLVDVKMTYTSNWTMFIILNGFVSVDTFFTISGTLASFNILKMLDKSGGSINIPLLYLHRYLRLTPTYMILVGILVTLIPYLGSGPNWFFMESESRNCEQNWWHNALYITNLVDYNGATSGACYGEAWYLSNDMQFFLLSPFIIYPLWKWPRIGLGFLSLLSLASIAIPGVITGVKKLPPSGIFSVDQKSFQTDVYQKPWTRIGPYIVGIWLGFILHKDSKGTRHSRLSLWVILGGWTLSTVTALSILFGIQSYYYPNQIRTTGTEIGAITYAGLHRFLWGVVIAWIIFACVKGHGGWINKFLSWSAFVPLGRLTFCAYLVSLYIQFVFHAGNLTPWHYSPYIYVNMFFAHLVMSFLLGYVVTMTVEVPLMRLEKIIFKQGNSESKNKMEA